MKIMTMFLVSLVSMIACGEYAEDSSLLAQLGSELAVGEGANATLGWNGNSTVRNKCKPSVSSHTCLLPDPADGYNIRVSPTQIDAVDNAILDSWDPGVSGFFEDRWFETADYWEATGHFSFQVASARTFSLVINNNLSANITGVATLPVTNVLRVSCPSANQTTLTESPTQAATYKKCSEMLVEIDVNSWEAWVNSITSSDSYRKKLTRRLTAKAQAFLMASGTGGTGDAMMSADFVQVTAETPATALEICLMNAYDPIGSNTTVTFLNNVCD